MVQQKKGLGKGLNALIFSPSHKNQNEAAPANAENSVINLDVSKIVPNPRQPRKYFDEDELQALSLSIKEQGIAQPILVRLKGIKYELVAGERRLRAAKKAGLNKVPVIIKDLTDEQALEVTIVENLQRENLNPIEEAVAYKMLYDQFSLSQDQIAQKVGKNRSTVSNSMRLLDLPKKIQDSIKKGSITAGHARAILSVTDVNRQIDIWKQILAGNLSVRDAEALISSDKIQNKSAKIKKIVHSNPHLQEIKDKLTESLGTKVELFGSPQKGKINIHYFSQEDLERIIEQIK